MERENQPAIEKADLIAGREELELEYRILMEQAEQRWQEIHVLENVLAGLEEQENVEADVQATTNAISSERQPIVYNERKPKDLYQKFLDFREKYDAHFHYIETAAVGSVAGGGGIPGYVEDPKRFLLNLGFNVTLGYVTAELPRLFQWIKFKMDSKHGRH